MTRTDLASGVATFVAYGLGMSLVLVAVAVAVASAQGAVVASLRRGSRYVDRAAAVLLIVAGLYVTGYWIFTLAVPPGSADQPGWALIAEWPVSLVERMSSWSVNHVQRWAGPIAAILLVAVLAALRKLLGRPPRADGEAEAVPPQAMESAGVSVERGDGAHGRS